MSSAWYTQMANDHRNWTASASKLFAGSMILRQEQDKEEARVLGSPSSVGPVSVALNTGDSQLLLTAFAVEAMLKAVWLKKGGILAKEGKYVGLPCEYKAKRWHDLVAMCDDAEVVLTPSERQVLKRLSDCSRFHGRYPVARHWEHMDPIFYWSYEWDTMIGQLVTRLWRCLGFSTHRVPIGGAAIPDPR